MEKHVRSLPDINLLRDHSKVIMTEGMIESSTVEKRREVSRNEPPRRHRCRWEDT